MCMYQLTKIDYPHTVSHSVLDSSSIPNMALERSHTNPGFMMSQFISSYEYMYINSTSTILHMAKLSSTTSTTSITSGTIATSSNNLIEHILHLHEHLKLRHHIWLCWWCLIRCGRLCGCICNSCCFHYACF